MLSPLSPALEIAVDDISDRAADLVNPASGLANDYLNVFNEVVMLIHLLPAMPNLAEDIAAWAPVGYREYFTRSTLAGRQSALRAYDRLDPAFRAGFDGAAADLGRLADQACTGVLALVAEGERNQRALAARCEREAALLRERLDRMTQLVNFGRARPADNPQRRTSELFDAA